MPKFIILGKYDADFSATAETMLEVSEILEEQWDEYSHEYTAFQVYTVERELKLTRNVTYAEIVDEPKPSEPASSVVSIINRPRQYGY